MQRLIFRTLVFFLMPLCLFAENSSLDQHDFKGKHFLASYLDCDSQALTNIDALLQAMDEAVGASGTCILQRTHHVFPPHGVTVVYLLAESHASIHTYPEQGACFVDLFTCGDHCSSARFHQLLQSYLKPQIVNARQFLRHQTIEEDTTFSLKDNF